MVVRIRLLRHAKSSWDDPSRDDKDRPLGERGRHDAPRMARWMAEHTKPPRYVVVSSARRTRETAEPVLDAYAIDDDHVSFDDDLYLADADEILACARASGADDVLLVAHNPGMASLARRLVPAADHERIGKFPTCAYLEVELDDLHDPDHGKPGRLIHYVKPKSIA